MPHTHLPHPEESPEGARLEGRTRDLQSEAKGVASASDLTPAAALAQAKRLVVKIGSARLSVSTDRQRS